MHGSTLHIDVEEKGAPRDGQPQRMNRRLFMQLLVFEHGTKQGDRHPDLEFQLQKALEEHQLRAVLYRDVQHPHGFALLSWSEDPAYFATDVRKLFGHGVFAELRERPEWNMLGRTYSTGYEPDLEWMLLRRPCETVCNPEWPWAIWYPLRRTGAFARLPGAEQGSILREHAQIGRAYGSQDLAHDVRLACHGLDTHDNEFVIGLIGKDLHPLSHVVQSMRKTRQTSEYIERMGPFFVGQAIWQAPLQKEKEVSSAGK